MIKTTKKEEKNTQPSFPCLLKHEPSGIIVLAVSKSSGTCVYTGSSHYIVGVYKDDWTFFDKQSWRLYNGIIELQNDKI